MSKQVAESFLSGGKSRGKEPLGDFLSPSIRQINRTEIVFLTPNQQGLSMITNVNADIEGLPREVVSLQQVGIFIGQIDGQRPAKKLMVCKRIQPEAGKPTHYLWDDGKYFDDTAKDEGQSYEEPLTAASSRLTPRIAPIEIVE